MGVLEAFSRIVQLGGAPERGARVHEMRAAFELRTGAFAPEDPWFEARSRAFWCDALTHVGFGREVEPALDAEDRAWLGPLERAHRGLFRVRALADGGAGTLLVDVWSGAELLVTLTDEQSRDELRASSGQLFDGRVLGAARPFVLGLLPGAIFHPSQATAAIDPVLAAARERGLSTDEALDALLRMEHMFRSLSRVKAAYAYRPAGLTPRAPPAGPALRRASRGPT